MRVQHAFFRRRGLWILSTDISHLITAQHCTAQHGTARHSTAQHGTARHSTARHGTARHSTAQRLPCSMWQEQPYTAIVRLASTRNTRESAERERERALRRKSDTKRQKVGLVAFGIVSVWVADMQASRRPETKRHGIDPETRDSSGAREKQIAIRTRNR